VIILPVGSILVDCSVSDISDRSLPFSTSHIEELQSNSNYHDIETSVISSMLDLPEFSVPTNSQDSILTVSDISDRRSSMARYCEVFKFFVMGKSTCVEIMSSE
jgi:hypothetical protein